MTKDTHSPVSVPKNTADPVAMVMVHQASNSTSSRQGHHIAPVLNPGMAVEAKMALNKVVFEGIVVDKPMVQEMKGGQIMVGLSIKSLQRRCGTRSDEGREGQEWHRVVVLHEQLARFAEASLGQGDKVYIEGELHTDRWLSETLETRTMTKIVLRQHSHKLRRLRDDRAPSASEGVQHRPFAAPQAAQVIRFEGWR